MSSEQPHWGWESLSLNAEANWELQGHPAAKGGENQAMPLPWKFDKLGRPQVEIGNQNYIGFRLWTSRFSKWATAKIKLGH